MLYPVNKPKITKEDIDLVSKSLAEGWISGEGPYVETFEKKFSEICNRKFGISVSNGSVALELVFDALDFPPGSEVLIPSFAIISCLAPLLRRGLVPIFIETDPYTWNISIDDALSKISPKTKAILFIHTYGISVDVDPLIEVCKENEIFLIEDAAEAHGVLYKNLPCGSFGDVSVFSFYANKLVATGEGGMVLTNNEKIAEKIYYLKNLAFLKDDRFKHFDLGWNFRLSSIQAALGVSQLRRLEEIVKHRIDIASIYKSTLGQFKDLEFQISETRYSKNVYWVVGINLKGELEGKKQQIVKRLENKGIQTRPFFYPLHLQPVLRKYGISSQVKLPNAESLYENGFYLPSGNGYSLQEIEDIARLVMIELKLLFSGDL